MILNNKTALVTGGGSGIGLAISKALLKQGTRVIICGRNKAKLEEVKQQYPEMEIEVCDITNTDQIKNLLAVVEEKHKGIDLLINNAGMFGQVDFPIQSIHLKCRIMKLMLISPVPYG